jgi:hypothetical protein
VHTSARPATSMWPGLRFFMITKPLELAEK